jgi:predicted metal-dependent RNase
MALRGLAINYQLLVLYFLILKLAQIKVGVTRNRSIIRSVMKRFNSQLVAINFNEWFTVAGYSAHADQKDLVNFVKRMRGKPAKIRIVHGDDEAKAVLKAKYESLFDCEVLIP